MCNCHSNSSLNAIPIFADIENDTFNIDPISVEKNMSEKTKAILAVDMFGHSCDISVLERLKKHNLKLIADPAQSPGVTIDKKVGTLADVGGFSFNYHKHIHTGEGGLIVTNDEQIYTRCQLIRNHAEAVVGDKGYKNLSNMIGFNFRMGEIEAAIGIEQIKKLDKLLEKKQRMQKLINGLSQMVFDYL